MWDWQHWESDVNINGLYVCFSVMSLLWKCAKITRKFCNDWLRKIIAHFVKLCWLSLLSIRTIVSPLFFNKVNNIKIQIGACCLKPNLFDIKIEFRGCLVIVSFPFMVLFTLLLLFDDNSTVCWSLLAALFHECGHVFAMIFNKNNPSQICFRAFSVDIIDINKTQRDYNTEVFILFSGPLANLIVASVLLSFYRIFCCRFLRVFATANLFLAVFNLLPIESLDGGQIVSNILLRKFQVRTAEKIAFVLSILTLLPIAILGFYVLLQSKYNFSLLFFSCYLLTSLFFKNSYC